MADKTACACHGYYNEKGNGICDVCGKPIPNAPKPQQTSVEDELRENAKLVIQNYDRNRVYDPKTGEPNSAPSQAELDIFLLAKGYARSQQEALAGLIKKNIRNEVRLFGECETKANECVDEAIDQIRKEMR